MKAAEEKAASPDGIAPWSVAWSKLVDAKSVIRLVQSALRTIESEAATDADNALAFVEEAIEDALPFIGPEADASS